MGDELGELEEDGLGTADGGDLPVDVDRHRVELTLGGAGAKKVGSHSHVVGGGKLEVHLTWPPNRGQG